MIYVLLLISISISFFSYNYMKLKMVSPTLWTSGMFAFFSFIYGITIFEINNDISIITVCVVSLFLVLTLVGESIGTSFLIVDRWGNPNRSDTHGEYIFIAKWKAILLTLFFLIVAIDRYRNLSSYVILNNGSYNGIMEMMNAARILFVRNRATMVLSSTLFNQLIYCCEICTYIFIYVFVHNMIICKKKDYLLLVILIPDITIRFLSTSRTSFMILGVAILLCCFGVLQQNGGQRRIHIPKQVYIGIVLFAVAFIIYGRIRNNAQSIPMLVYLQMYTCCSIYGLDYLLVNGWQENPYFGMFTLRHIFDLFGLNRVPVQTWNRMLDFNIYHSHSNVFTSLMGPISDYGIIATMLLRFIVAIISAYIINGFIGLRRNDAWFYVALFLAVNVLYCYFYSATGDIFCDVFLNPGLMFRYCVYTFILVKTFIKPQCIPCAAKTNN